MNMKLYRRYRTHTGIVYYAFPLLKKHGVELVYSTKQSIIDGVPCETDMKHIGVQKKFLESLGFNIENLETVKQVHHGECIMINPDGSIEGDRERSDGIISADPDKILGIRTADCIAVGLVNATEHVIALLHCGWRGLVAGIIPNAINVLEKKFGISPATMFACLGPSIGACCYPVRNDVLESFRKTFTFTDSVISRISSGQFSVDLKKTARLILKGCNLSENSILSIDLCTSCNKDSFYSYRREGKSCGHLMAFMAWNPDCEKAVKI